MDAFNDFLEANVDIIAIVLIILMASIPIILLWRHGRKKEKKPYISVVFNDKCQEDNLGKERGQISFSNKFLAVMWLCILIFQALTFFDAIESGDSDFLLVALRVFTVLLVMLATIRRSKLTVYENGITYRKFYTREKTFMIKDIKVLQPVFHKSGSFNFPIFVFDGVSYNIILKDGNSVNMKMQNLSEVERLAVYLDFADNPYIEDFQFYYPPKGTGAYFNNRK